MASKEADAARKEVRIGDAIDLGQGDIGGGGGVVWFCLLLEVSAQMWL